MKKARKTAIDARDYQPRKTSLERARKAMANYTLIIQPDADLGYAGYAMELPTVLADGETPAACAAALQFSLETALAALAEQGLALPPPHGQATRSEQVNIRLTPHEKQALARESSRRGFRGVGDLIRTQAIDQLLLHPAEPRRRAS